MARCLAVRHLWRRGTTEVFGDTGRHSGAVFGRLARSPGLQSLGRRTLDVSIPPCCMELHRTPQKAL